LREVAFSVDGQYILAGLHGRTVYVCDAETSECLMALEREGNVASIAAGATGHRAIVGQLETAIRDLDAGETVAWFAVPLDWFLAPLTGGTWAGTRRLGDHLHIIKLEGAVGPERHHVDDANARSCVVRP